MKLRSLILGLVSISIALTTQAQERKVDRTNQVSKINNSDINRHARDLAEVFYPTADDDCANTVTEFGIMEFWGSVSGMNEYGDKEKAQMLTYPGADSYDVVGAVGFFSTGSVVNDGLIRMNVYDVDAQTGGPGNLLSISDSLKVSQLEVPHPDSNFISFTIFTFSESQIATLSDSNFFISADMSEAYQTSDTVSLFSTVEGCGDGTDTWEKWDDDTWSSVFDVWGDESNPFHVDFLLAAVVEFTPDTMTTADHYIQHEDLRLYPATPNPANDFTVLNYSIDRTSPVSVEVFDISGKIFSRRNYVAQQTGRHQEMIHTHDLNPGTYYYSIATDNGRLVSRFVVQ